jgi:glutathione S-transferase
MADLTLYCFPQSTCSQKVRLALWEKGIPFEERHVDHKNREHLSDWYLKLNPNGVVPTLTDGDDVIIDSSVILEYLEEVYPDHAMSPDNPVKRAHMRKWLRYLEEVPTPAIRVPSFNKHLAKRYENMEDDAYQAMAEAHPVRKHFYKRMNKTGFSAEETAESIDRLDSAAQRVSDALESHGKDWIMGDMLTIVDPAYMPTVDRMIDLGLGDMIFDRPALKAWYERYAKRPAFEKTFYEGARLTDIFGKDAA